MFKVILAVGTGGFIGSVGRFYISKYFQVLSGSSFPLGTFVVNVIGCFMIGLFYGLFMKYSDLSPAWRLFLTTGFCGGFTTFSTFSYENIALLRDGQYVFFFSYTSASLLIGLLFTFVGLMLSKMI
ncbi:MAG TPA: fluoride efflux transporter CrcB [Bacteroidales bacterium]|nr:fluoride efflux transporter CrcB [Bacteroidales bacterium]